MAIPFILIGAAVLAGGFGAKKGYDGYQDKSRANEIVEESKNKYEKNKFVFDKIDTKTEENLTRLGELQLHVGVTFSEFKIIAESLLEKINKSSSTDIKLSIPKHEIDKIEQLSISAVNYVGKVAGAGVVGAASAYAVYGGVMAFAAASTGTSIATLSGVAAYNATLAAIGGGSLAAGGLGMAGGTMILGGVVAAPILAIAGWAFASHAEEALGDALKTRDEVDEIVAKLELAGEKLTEANQYINSIFNAIQKHFKVFMQYFNELKEIEEIIKNKADISMVEDSIILTVENGFAIAAILTDIITTPLFLTEKDKQGNVLIENDVVVMKTDSNGMRIINAEGISDVLLKANA